MSVLLQQIILLIKSKHLRGGFVGKFLVIFRTERLPQSSKYHQNKHFLNVIHVCSWPDQGEKKSPIGRTGIITELNWHNKEIIYVLILGKVRCNGIQTLRNKFIGMLSLFKLALQDLLDGKRGGLTPNLTLSLAVLVLRGTLSCLSLSD